MSFPILNSRCFCESRTVTQHGVAQECNGNLCTSISPDLMCVLSASCATQATGTTANYVFQYLFYISSSVPKPRIMKALKFFEPSTSVSTLLNYSLINLPVFKIFFFYYVLKTNGYALFLHVRDSSSDTDFNAFLALLDIPAERCTLARKLL